MGNQKLCASNISWIASIVKSWIIISSHSLRSRNVDETDQVWVACISEYLITLYLVKLWQYLTIPHLHTHNIKINIKHAEEAGAFIHETLGEAGDDVMSGLGLWLYLESLLTLAGPVSIPTSRPWALLQLSSPGPAWQNIWVPRRYYQSGGARGYIQFTAEELIDYLLEISTFALINPKTLKILYSLVMWRRFLEISRQDRYYATNNMK